MTVIEENALRKLLPARRADSHKGDFGRLMIVAGNLGMGGAGLLCAQAGLRCGAGLVALATQPQHTGAALARLPELMVHGIASGQALQEHLDWPDTIVIGPGLGQNAWAEQVLYQTCEHARKHGDIRLVVDADALNLLARKPHWLQGLHNPLIITPHPGEAARLLGCDIAQVQQERKAAALQLAGQYHCCAVLKGAGTLVAHRGDMQVCRAGNPGMATAGTGDVLAGVIGGLWAQGVPYPQVAAMGVWLHATAGDLAAQQHGQHGMIASDLFAPLQSQLRRLAEAG